MSDNNITRKPVIFLDRDGVLTIEKSYVKRQEDMEIFPYATECVRKIHEKGYLAIVITNQSGVGRGMFLEEELLKMNKRIEQEVLVDAVYYCPHWYDKDGEHSQYNVECSCRKPRTGMIEKAVSDFRSKGIDIDIQNSYFVGDRGTDILTGINAGMKTALVESGYGSKTLNGAVPDYVCGNLEDFVQMLEVI